MSDLRAAVVGAGTMGRGIAALLVRAGVAVSVYDERPPAADAFGADVADSVELCPTLEACLRGADVVTEAVVEDRDVKRALLATIQQVAGPVPIASNTSTFRPGDLAEGLPHPEAVLVAHFFHPADVVPLVEVVRGPRTGPAAVEAVVGLLERAGKTVVRLEREVDGFVANRLQAALYREALHLLREGVASAADIDLAVTDGLGPRWSVAGPFEIMDRGGLDVWRAVTTQLFGDLAVDTATPAEILERVAAGHLGVKTGAGFGTYEGDDGAAYLRRLRAVLEAASDSPVSR